MNYAGTNRRQTDTLIGKGKVAINPSTGKPQKFNSKACKSCGGSFTPLAPSHRYCCQDCQDEGWTSAYLKRNYNITYREWKDIFDSQDGKCAICGSEGFFLNKSARLKLVVDHDHITGKVRGMLCHNCNRGLGMFQDSEDNLETALRYLQGATTISKESTPK